MSATGDEPTCPRHPGVVAYVRCQRCGRPTCPDCQRVAPVGIHCVDCVAEARARERPVKSALGLTVARGRPWVTYALIAVNAAVYVFGPAIWGSAWQVHLGVSPGPRENEWWRWVTAGFAHADVMHIGFNMLALVMFGSAVEPLLGSWRFGVLYAASLIGSSGFVVWLGEPWSLHLGASGAIFGVLAAYIIIASRLKIPAQAVMIQGAAWLLLGFAIPNLSWEGHLGGVITGAIVTLAILPRPGASNGVRGIRR
jgi:membrane associated rhomboid family serine protease